ncbi:MAG TPA: trypsin-like peptidase domain-containing protein [Chthonomonadaceae bacterium]|nr:trypsin-like peptidase domain-containing protein [Chthonomonadaceae bacterium]
MPSLLLASFFCLLAPCALPAQTAPPERPPAAQVSRPRAASGNILEQIEGAVIAIVQEVSPSVVTIEGRPLVVAFPAPNVNFDLRVADPNALEKLAPEKRTEYEKALREAQEAQSKALKKSGDTLRMLLGPATTGTGFLLQGGYVVTTAEVTEGMREPTVVLTNGQRLKVESVNANAFANIAVLKVVGAPPTLGLRWGDSDQVQPGCFAITIGNQAGFPNSVSLGLIAGVNRSGQSGARRYQHLLQFQGAVGMGSSGGPVFNARGEVIGMIVAMPAGGVLPRAWQPGAESDHYRGVAQNRQEYRVSAASAEDTERKAGSWSKEQADAAQKAGVPQGDASGNRAARAFPRHRVFLFNTIANTGFALPSNELQHTTTALIKGEKLPTPNGWLGVQIGELDSKAPLKGALIEAVYEGGPADRAGLLPGDIVLAVDGSPIQEAGQLRQMAGNTHAGQTLRLEVQRGGAFLHLMLRVELKPDPALIDRMPLKQLRPQTGYAPPAAHRQIGRSRITRLGATVSLSK